MDRFSNIAWTRLCINSIDLIHFVVCSMYLYSKNNICRYHECTSFENNYI